MKRARTRLPDLYLVRLGAVGCVCFFAAMAMLLTEPHPQSPILGVPLGAWLMGGLGGLVTLSASPARARRHDARRPGLLFAISVCRLLAACVLGALGRIVIAAMADGAGLVFPPWFFHVGSAAFGVLEMPVNDVLLRALGLIDRRAARERFT